MKRPIFAIFLVLFLASCSNTNDSNEPIISDDKHLFSVKIGKIWIYDKNNVEASFTVTNFDTSEWVIQFWDTVPKSKLPTYTLEWKELDNGFPRYTEFGLAVTDSSYLFGTKKHPFVSPSFPSDFFVFMFEIPKKLNNLIQSKLNLTKTSVQKLYSGKILILLLKAKTSFSIICRLGDGICCLLPNAKDLLQQYTVKILCFSIA